MNPVPLPSATAIQVHRYPPIYACQRLESYRANAGRAGPGRVGSGRVGSGQASSIEASTQAIPIQSQISVNRKERDSQSVEAED